MPTETAHERPSIWSIAGPSILVFMLSSIANLLIIKVVASLGTPSVAAATAGQRILFILIALLMGMGSATTALVSRAWGAGDISQATAYTRLAMGVGLVVCVTLALLGAALAEPLAVFFHLHGETRALAVGYLRWLCLFAPAHGLVMILSTACRATGDAKTPLYLGIISNGTSVLCAYGLAYGAWGLPAMGVHGAAIGWGLAFTLCFLAYMFLWIQGRLRLPFTLPSVLPSVLPSALPFALPLATPSRAPRASLNHFLRICLPATTEQLIMQAAMLLFIGFVASYGTSAFAAYGVGINLFGIALVIGLGFSIAASAVVGQLLGAGDPEGALQSAYHALKLAVATLLGTGILSALFSTPLSQLMVSDPKVASTAAQFVLILGLMQPLMAVDLVFGGAMRGAGDTRFPLIAGMVAILGVRLPLAALFSWLQFPVWTIFSVFVVDQLVKALLLSWRFRQKRWLSVL